MKHPDKIYPIDFAGFFDLKNEPYYEGKSLLNIDEYPEAESFSDEVCHRWNCYDEIVEALIASSVTLRAFLPDAFATISLVESAINKAKANGNNL